MIDFYTLFQNYKIPFDIQTKGWIQTNCPWCGDSSFNLGFNLSQGYSNCWRCGWHPLPGTLSLLLGIPKSEVSALISEYNSRSIILTKLNKKEARQRSIKLPTDGFTPLEKNYLFSRHFRPKELSEKYSVCGGGIVGDWKYRIIIPLILNGKIVSWTARSILTSEQLKKSRQPRYKQLKIEDSVIDPKTTFYNLDHAPKNKAVLMEGAFDVLRMGDGFICSFGTELTQSQLRTLKNRFAAIIILFDSEKEAQAKAKKFGLVLSAIGLDVEVVDAFSDYGKNDAGELSPLQASDLRRQLGL
jgi:hypothetical protein